MNKWSGTTICNSIGWEYIINGHLYRKSFPFLIEFGQPHSQSTPQHPSCIVFMTPPSQFPTYLLHCKLRVLSSFLCLESFTRSLTGPNLSEWELQSYLANLFAISWFQFQEAKDRSDQHGAQMLTRLVHVVFCLESDAERLLHHVTPCSSTLYVTEWWEESCPVLNQLWNQAIFPSLPLPEREW